MEAQAKLDALSDDEYKLYDSLRKKFDGASTGTLTKGEKPAFQEGKQVKDENIISSVLTYAKAIGVDPATAFDRIFTGQKIRRVDNGTIIVERVSLEDSQAFKKANNANNSEQKLDHVIPLQLGGTNNPSNYKIVTTEEWKSYTPVENKLGKMLRAGTITKKEAQEKIKAFKEGKITASEI